MGEIERQHAHERPDGRGLRRCLRVFIAPLNEHGCALLRGGKKRGRGGGKFVLVSFVKLSWMVSWIVIWVLIRAPIQIPIMSEFEIKRAFFEVLTPL